MENPNKTKAAVSLAAGLIIPVLDLWGRAGSMKEIAQKFMGMPLPLIYFLVHEAMVVLASFLIAYGIVGLFSQILDLYKRYKAKQKLKIKNWDTGLGRAIVDLAAYTDLGKSYGGSSRGSKEANNMALGRLIDAAIQNKIKIAGIKPGNYTPTELSVNELKNMDFITATLSSNSELVARAVSLGKKEIIYETLYADKKDISTAFGRYL